MVCCPGIAPGWCCNIERILVHRSRGRVSVHWNTDRRIGEMTLFHSIIKHIISHHYLLHFVCTSSCRRSTLRFCICVSIRSHRTRRRLSLSFFKSPAFGLDGEERRGACIVESSIQVRCQLYAV